LINSLIKAEKSPKLTKQQVINFRDGLVKTDNEETTRKSKDTANRILSILKAALNMNYEDGYIVSKVAWDTVKPFQNVSKAREVFLSQEEVNRLLNAINGSFQDLVTGALLTGARYGELASLIVDDFDKKEGTLKLTSNKGAAINTRHATLSSQAILFFTKMCKAKLPKAYVFTKEDGSLWGKSHQQRPMKKAVIEAKLPEGTVLYSLRHYYISKALLAGVNIHALAKNCGTSVKMIETNYAKFIKSDIKDMLDNISIM